MLIHNLLIGFAKVRKRNNSNPLLVLLLLKFANFGQSSIMINSFISLVAKDILQVAGSDLKDLAVIFPNRRAGAIFRQELIGQVLTPSWSPGIFSIDDWLVGLSGLEKTDKLVELALLFQVVKHELPHIEAFANFIDLGETLLADFDDADKYLADPLKLFTALNEIKKIDNQFDITSDEELVDRIRVFWSSFGSGRSSHQEKWLEIWDKLYPIYKAFNNCLLDKGIGTSGMCYRKAAEDLIQGKITPGRYKKVAFVGFNILTSAEETIFNHLRDNGIATFYWDYHPYYLEGTHEAGKFIQHYLKLFPPPPWFQPFPDGAWDFFHSPDPKETVTVVPVTSNTGQVQALLNDIQGRPNVKRGIILSDESLFSDLLSSWPDDTLPVNFTSGYPLRDTQAAGFFNNLINIYLDFNQSIDKPFCKAGLILAFLRHPWAKWLTGDSTDSRIQLVQRRYPESVPAEFVNGESRLSPWIGTLNIVVNFLDRINGIGTRLMAFEALYNQIEKAAIGSVISQAGIFREVIGTYSLKLDAKSLSKLFSQFLNTSKITLETDRDACNQVTGILETRLVDFDEVFILSFNEGIWPSKSLPGSLIPYSMRKIFHLPTAENRDAMYAYYFYRLIQRTKSLFIYYLTGHMDDVIRSGEKSRYITQLQYEFPKNIEFRLEPPARVGNSPSAIIIRKVGVVKERLGRYLARNGSSKSLSPSAINEYMDCSLRFALERIFDFKEPDEIAYASEPKGFGILIHQVMNRLYKEFIGIEKGPDAGWLQRVIHAQDRLAEIILEEYNVVLKEPGAVKPGGKELLAMEVVRQFLNKILEFDQRILPLRILGLEQKFRMQYPIEIGGQTVTANLNGIIDRIDQVPEGIRIVDYKTGNCELNAKTIDEIFDRGSAKRPKEVFQVLLYCEFYLNQTSANADLMPCLFRLGRFRAGDNEHRTKVAGKEIVFPEIRNEFNTGFKNILEDLFNPDIPFVQSDDDQVCRYCPFTGICSRENYS